MVVSSIKSFGRYCTFMTQVFRIPEKWREFFKQLVFEINKLGVDSIPLVIIISIFHRCGDMHPDDNKHCVTDDSFLFHRIGDSGDTPSGILLHHDVVDSCAGKVGSNISSEIGTMRVTEQIDAMEIMGLNAASYIVLPKIVGFVLFVPVLCILSMFMGLLGGALVAQFTDMISMENYVFGIQSFFNEWYIWYAIIKTLFFAFIITSVAAYYGFMSKEGPWKWDRQARVLLFQVPSLFSLQMSY